MKTKHCHSLLLYLSLWHSATHCTHRKQQFVFSSYSDGSQCVTIGRWWSEHHQFREADRFPGKAKPWKYSALKRILIFLKWTILMWLKYIFLLTLSTSVHRSDSVPGNLTAAPTVGTLVAVYSRKFIKTPFKTDYPFRYEIMVMTSLWHHLGCFLRHDIAPREPQESIWLFSRIRAPHRVTQI